MIAKITNLFHKNAFLRNVGILTGGTIFAQGILVLTLPLLTRIYTPEDFDLLAVYTSLISLCVVVASLRFNIAIPLPEEDIAAMDLCKLAIASASTFTLILTIFIVTIPDVIVTLLKQPQMLPFLWMIPVGVFFACLYDIAQYWASRKKRFALITKTRVTRSVGAVSVQLGSASLFSSAFGLIAGQVVYGAVGVFGLFRSIWQNDHRILCNTQMSRLINRAKEYKRYPKLSVPEAFFNTIGNELPVIMIAAISFGAEAGYLMIAIRVMGLPMGLIGSSVAQVYLADASMHFHSGSLSKFTMNTMIRMAQISVIPLISVGLLAPWVFVWIFGPEWERAGIIVSWLTPWFILQLIASPVSMVLHVTGNVSLSMWLQVFGAFLRVGVVTFAIYFAPSTITELFAIASALFYAIYIYIIFSIIR